MYRFFKVSINTSPFKTESLQFSGDLSRGKMVSFRFSTGLTEGSGRNRFIHFTGPILLPWACFHPHSKLIFFSRSHGRPDGAKGGKAKAFRKERDRFFKEDAHSPLKESDRKRFKGLSYYPIDLRYAMIGSIEKYPVGTEGSLCHPSNQQRGRKEICEIWPV